MLELVGLTKPAETPPFNREGRRMERLWSSAISPVPEIELRFQLSSIQSKMLLVYFRRIDLVSSMNITLTRGLSTEVDDDDFGFLSQFKWHAVKGSSTFYAARFEGRTMILMHRVIMGVFDSGIKIDHRDGHGLNNHRLNLRPCTHKQNLCNQKGRRDGKFKGVYGPMGKKRPRWQVVAFGKYRGSFGSEEEAARFYDKIATSIGGEFARLNFPIDDATRCVYSPGTMSTPSAASIQTAISHLSSCDRGKRALKVLDQLSREFSGLDSENRKSVETVFLGLSDYPSTIQTSIRSRLR